MMAVRLIAGGLGIALTHLVLWPAGYFWFGLAVDGTAVALIMWPRRTR